MTDAERYFLIVAEELNISKAAQRLFISHQNISQHIQKLEEKYGVQLLIRKPRLELTPAGRDLADTLAHIQVLEQQMALRISGKDSELSGAISLGMPYPRAIFLMPAIIERFLQRYPGIKVTFYTANSGILAQKVLQGTLDMFLGVQYQYASKLNYDFLLDENIYVVIPAPLLSKAIPNGLSGRIEQLCRGIDIQLLTQLPFTMNSPGSSIRAQIDDFLIQEQVQLSCVFECSSHELQLSLCERGIAASFCVQMHLSTIRRINQGLSDRDRLYVFPVNRLDTTNRLYIASHKDSYITPYKEFMHQIVREVICEYEMLDSNHLLEINAVLPPWNRDGRPGI